MRKDVTRANKWDMTPWFVCRNDYWGVFDRFTKDLDMPVLTAQNQFVPKVELKEMENVYQICVEVPGMDEKDLNVSLKDQTFFLKGERKNESEKEDKEKGIFLSEFSCGHFNRAIPRSEDADPQRVGGEL